MVKNEITQLLAEALEELGFLSEGEEVKIEINVPQDATHGDYSANIAMIIFANSEFTIHNSQFNSPLELAEEIVKNIKAKNLAIKTFEKIEAVKPGFINFFLSKDSLISQLNRVLEQGEKVGTALKSSKKIMVEFAHPNTHKLFHIGHLRNITLGESMVRLLQSQGNEVIRANYQGDVGLHIAKALYGLLQRKNFEDEFLQTAKEPLNNKINLLGEAYAYGSKLYEEDEKAKETIRDINYLIYAAAQRFQKEKGINPGSTDYMKFIKGRDVDVDKIYDLWKTTRQWSLDYFETIYKRVYSHYDRYYFESECLSGVDLAKEALEKGILKESDGAIVFDGKPYGLDTRVFVNSLGLPTYEGKELSLSFTQFKEHGHLDKLIHVLGPEQVSFTKVTFKVEELLEIQKGQQQHFAYGWVRLKEGKMSSRLGQVILGESLLDEAKEKLKANYQMDEEVAEMVAVGAVKYSILKVSPFQEIVFDMDESISLEGNSGPYIQYVFARTQSVLSKAKQFQNKSSFTRHPLAKLEIEEVFLLRALSHFSEVVSDSSINLAPNLLANYLFDLAKKFNLFYQKHKILESQNEEFRVNLTRGVGQIIKNGLHLLGIKAPERM